MVGFFVLCFDYIFLFFVVRYFFESGVSFDLVNEDGLIVLY